MLMPSVVLVARLSAKGDRAAVRVMIVASVAGELISVFGSGRNAVVAFGGVELEALLAAGVVVVDVLDDAAVGAAGVPEAAADNASALAKYD